MWLYILHYDELLHHTQHYCGQTPHPPNRFAAHARGAGSAITAEYARRGIKFSVGMLAQCSLNRANEFERNLKNAKNLSQYCSECCRDRQVVAKCWPGTTRYPVDQQALLAQASWTTARRREVYITGAATREELDGLQLNHGDSALGFLTNEAIAEALRRHHVRVLVLDATPRGYILFSQEPKTLTIKIQQIVVDRDHRGENYGRALVEHLASEYPAAALRCNVRATLPANMFWTAIGFTAKTTKTHKTSGQTLVEYHRPCFMHYKPNVKAIEE